MGSSLKRHPARGRGRNGRRSCLRLQRRNHRLDLELLEERSLCAISEIAVPTGSSGLQGITLGPDGAFWFTELNANQIGRVSMTGTVTEFPILGHPNGAPVDIAAG